MSQNELTKSTTVDPPPRATELAGIASVLGTPRQAFGDYEVLEEIARGGMGIVFKARQVSLNRLVALKMIRGGTLDHAEARRRFHTEAQAAAHLNHPNIVAIHEIGEVSGHPFFSMDYVPGRSLAQVIREQPLEPRQAARCLQAIAGAIHHAHQHGILHRDLKPSNVLIDRNEQPRVTDFGLAKVLSGESELTVSGVIMGSPSYMSPEQAEGKLHAVTVRSDVYSLGAILYELLSRRPPFKADSSLETLRQVRETEPVSPRLLNMRIPRDLETVCLKCLAKDPTRRYPTAQDVAEDLQRFLNNEPVVARPVSFAEGLWRWCRRKPALAGLGTTALGLFLAVSIGGPVAAYRINRERLRAERLAQNESEARQRAEVSARQAKESDNEARALLRFFEDKLLAAARPKGTDGGLGRDATIREAVEASEPLIATVLSQSPHIEARIRNTIGRTYLHLGEPLKAIQQLERALSLRRQHQPSNHLAIIESMQQLADAYRKADRLEDCILLAEQTLALCRTNLHTNHSYTIAAMGNLAVAYHEAKRLEEALSLDQALLEIWKKTSGEPDPAMLVAMANLAAVHLSAGRFTEAIPLMEESLRLSQAKFGSNTLDTLPEVNNLAAAYQKSGQPEKAIPLYLGVLKLAREQLGPSHPTTSLIINNLAVAYVVARRGSEALALFEEAYHQTKNTLGPNHRDTLLWMDNLANAYQDGGQMTNALRLFEEELAIRRAKHGSDKPETLATMKRLASAYLSAQLFTDAEMLLVDLIAVQRKSPLAATPAFAGNLILLGQARLHLRRYAEAEQPLRESVGIFEKTQPGLSPTFGAQSLLGWALLGRKKYADAELVLRQSYAGLEKRDAERPSPSHTQSLRETALRLVELYEAWDKPELAADWREKLRERQP